MGAYSFFIENFLCDLVKLALFLLCPRLPLLVQCFRSAQNTHAHHTVLVVSRSAHSFSR